VINGRIPQWMKNFHKKGFHPQETRFRNQVLSLFSIFIVCILAFRGIILEEYNPILENNQG
jgi:hypothetical protein